MKFNMCASGARSIDGSKEANTQKVTVDYFKPSWPEAPKLVS